MPNLLQGGAVMGWLESLQLPGALQAALRSPALWVMALLLVSAEAGCNLQARDYPDGVAVALAVQPNGALVADTQPTNVALDRFELIVRDGSVLVADGLVAIRGSRAATGAEAIGSVLGTWLAAIPAGLLLLVMGAWLLPGYYRGQSCSRPAGRTAFKPGSVDFRRVFTVRLISLASALVAALVGAAPGLFLVVLVYEEARPALALIAVAMLFGGALAGWLWVRLGLMFADRHAVLGHTSCREALATSWARGRGRRLRRLRWMLVAWLLELVGSLGWIAWFAGFITHPLARAIADTMLTRLYLTEESLA